MPLVRNTALGSASTAKPGGVTATGLCLLLVAVVTALLGFAPAGAAAAGQSVTFGLDPAPGSTVENGFFSLHLDSGAQATQTVRVSNQSDQDADVRLAPVDATTAQKGGVVYGESGSAPTGDGSWITLDKTELHLPAGTQQDIGFRVSVPRGARPGVHLVGIIAYSPDAATSQSVQSTSGAGAALFIKGRRAIAVQITLPGPADAQLVISGVTTDARPNGLNFLVAVANNGNGLTKGRGHLSITGPATFATDFEIDTVVPRTAFTYPVVWTKTPVSGTYHVKVAIDSGTTSVSFTGDVPVGVSEQAALRNRIVPSADTAARPKTTSSGGVPLIVGVIDGLMITVIAGGAIALLARSSMTRRRRRSGDAPHP